MHLFLVIPTNELIILNLYSCNCLFIQKLCEFVLQSHLECSMRISVCYSSENSLWAGFMNPSLLTSPFSHFPFKCCAFTFEMLCISPAILNWSSYGASPNNGPILCWTLFPTSSQPALSKSPSLDFFFHFYLTRNF